MDRKRTYAELTDSNVRSVFRTMIEITFVNSNDEVAVERRDVRMLNKLTEACSATLYAQLGIVVLGRGQAWRSAAERWR